LRHKPKIYLWYEENNFVEEIYIPIEEDVFREEEVVVDSNNEIELFIRSLVKQGVAGNLQDGSFESKLRGVLRGSEIRKETKLKICKVLEKLRNEN